MVKRILVDGAYPQETRVVVLNDDNIEEIEYETYNKQQIKGNIYLAKIVRVEPSLQAAFIDYGGSRNGFLPFSEIHHVYYHIPSSDRDKLEAELELIKRPEITSEDIEEQESDNRINVPDEKLFTLDSADDLDSPYELPQNTESETEEVSDALTKSKTKFYSQYKIQDVIKRGQIILVQAQKEARGNKGASFTSFISLAGKYCVLIPNSDGSNGVSRKIANVEERRRLKGILDDMLNKESKTSLIMRTAGVKRTSYEIKRDYDYLVRLWNKIREITLQSTAPAFIHMEEDIIHKTVRDMYDHNVKEVLVQGNYVFNCTHEIMHNMLPSEVDKIVEYKSNIPLFTKFNVEEKLSNLYQPVTELASGGYIVINPTEALIAIDVNSGRATSERNIEETAYRTNLEAAKEIARQLKLRDLSGLIVVDFIDMEDSKHRKSVERTFKDVLSRDRARIQVGNISSFGLLEMSRQRLRGSFLEVNAKVCDHCSGKGIVRADESNAMLILRTLEQEICKITVNIVNVYAHSSSVLYLLNHKRQQVRLIEEKYNITLNLLFDPAATADSFSIETVILKPEEQESLKEAGTPLLTSTVSLFEPHDVALAKTSSDQPATQKKKTKKWKDRKARGDKNKEAVPATETEEKPDLVDHHLNKKEAEDVVNFAEAETESSETAPINTEEGSPKPRKRRLYKRNSSNKKKPADKTEESNS